MRLHTQAQGMVGPPRREAGAGQRPAVDSAARGGPWTARRGALPSQCVLNRPGQPQGGCCSPLYLMGKDKPFFWLPFTIFNKGGWGKAWLGYF